MPREGTFTLILTSLALAWSLPEYGLVTVGSNIQLIGEFILQGRGCIEHITHDITGETAVRDRGAAGGLGVSVLYGEK